MNTATFLNTVSKEYSMDVANDCAQCARCGVAIDEGQGVVPLNATSARAEGRVTHITTIQTVGWWCQPCSRRWRPQRKAGCVW